MQSFLAFLRNNSFIIGAIVTILAFAFLWWASQYFVSIDKYERDVEVVERNYQLSQEAVREINHKLNLIIEGQRTLQLQLAAQNVINEQVRQEYIRLHERVQFLERRGSGTGN